MHPEDVEECGHRQDGLGVRCNRPVGHHSPHGYAALTWDRDDEEQPAEADTELSGLHQMIADAVSLGVQQAMMDLAERLVGSDG
jgi:hypothetical protein